MKKLVFLMFLGLTVAFSSCNKDEDDNGNGNDDFLASTEVQTKAIVLEQYTGVRCGYCPQGATIAKGILDDNPGKAVVVAIHAGSFAAPQAGWANFTTSFGPPLVSNAGVTGYPSGTINRHVFTGEPKMSLNRGAWVAAGNQIKTQNAPVNLGAKSTYNPATRELTIKVDLYYTATETEPNHINIALLQDGIVAKQSGGSDNYVHNNMLRDFVTGQWGDPVPAGSTTVGSKYTKTYKYTLPEDVNGVAIPPGGGQVIIDDCKLAIYVARDKVEVLNGISISAK